MRREEGRAYARPGWAVGEVDWDSFCLRETGSTGDRGAAMGDQGGRRLRDQSETACKHELRFSQVCCCTRLIFRQYLSLSALLGVGAAMPIRSFVEPGAFDPEAIGAMSEALEAALKELEDSGEPEVVRERLATRIIAAAKLGERDPARLLEAALREPG